MPELPPGRLPSLYADHERRHLFWLLKELPPGAILELGAFYGSSAWVLLRACPDRLVVLLDPWKEEVFMEQHRFGEGKARASVAKIMSECRNCLGLPLFGHDLKDLWRIDLALLHVDDDHRMATTLENLEIYGPWVVPRGFIAMHDWNEAQVRSAWQSWKGNTDFDSHSELGILKIFQKHGSAESGT